MLAVLSELLVSPVRGIMGLQEWGRERTLGIVPAAPWWEGRSQAGPVKHKGLCQGCLHLGSIMNSFTRGDVWGCSQRHCPHKSEMDAMHR